MWKYVVPNGMVHSTETGVPCVASNTDKLYPACRLSWSDSETNGFNPCETICLASSCKAYNGDSGGVQYARAKSRGVPVRSKCFFCCALMDRPR